jgi:hypothetical protein
MERHRLGEARFGVRRVLAALQQQPTCRLRGTARIAWVPTLAVVRTIQHQMQNRSYWRFAQKLWRERQRFHSRHAKRRELAALQNAAGIQNPYRRFPNLLNRRSDSESGGKGVRREMGTMGIMKTIGVIPFVMKNFSLDVEVF